MEGGQGMKLYYGGFEFSRLGDLRIAVSREYENTAEGMPLWAKVKLSVTIDTYESSFAGNEALLEQARAALKTQHQQLIWTDDEVALTYVDQTATVSSQGASEEWGTWNQSLPIEFQFFENLNPEAVPLGITLANADLVEVGDAGTGDKAQYALGAVTRWRDEIVEDLVQPTRTARRMPALRVRVEGVFRANPQEPLADRRTFLMTTRNRLVAGLTTGAAATLLYASQPALNLPVTVENFVCELDQHAHGISWSLTAVTVLYPDLGNYAFGDWTVTERDGTQGLDNLAGNTGEMMLTLAGRILAATKAQALAKLATVRDMVRGSHGYNVSRTIRAEIGDVVADTPDGSTHVELTFTIEWSRSRSDVLLCTFTKSGAGGSPVNLGKVLGFAHRYSARRFNEQRSQRAYAGGQVTLRGVFLASQTIGVEGRRAQLASEAAALRAAVNSADGTLVYGGAAQTSVFNKVVRVEDFTAEPNQLLNGLDWSLTAVYSEFPNEAGYATVEYTVTPREATEDGDETLMLAGRILAQSEAAARSKLDSVRATVLAANGYAATQVLRRESQASSVFANGDKTTGLTEAADGTTFTELTFNEEYRRRKSAATAVSWTLRSSDAEETRNGFIVTTYAGTVTASGATASAAYAAASAKALALGGNKHPFLLRATQTWSSRQTRTDNAVEFVSLEFAYEYQRKGTRQYFEISVESLRETFGSDGERATGFIVAADEVTARAFYGVQVKPLWSAQRVRDERTSAARARLDGEDHFVRLDFQLSAFTPKAARATVRYGIEVDRDYLTLEQLTTISGSCWANGVRAANETVDELLGLAQGTNVRDRRVQDMEYVEQDSDRPTRMRGYLVKLDFSISFAMKLTGVDGILSCEVTEEVEFSGTRWVVQDLPRNASGGGGVSVVQDAGVEAGRRRVSGSVTAATEAAALAWANTQRGLLTGDNNGNRYELPPRRGVTFAFVARTDGVARGNGANVQVFRVAFEWGEILPLYAYTAGPPAAPGGFLPAALPPNREGYVRNETSGKWHKLRLRTNEDGQLEQWVDPAGVD